MRLRTYNSWRNVIYKCKKTFFSIKTRRIDLGIPTSISSFRRLIAIETWNGYKQLGSVALP